MKEKIIAALKTKYANLGFSQKAFDGVAEYLGKTVTDESNLETAVSGVEPLLRVFQAEADRLRTENAGLKAERDELKKAGGGKPEIEPEPKPDPDKGGDDLSKSIAAAVAAAMKPLQDEIANFKQGRVTETRKQQLGAVIGKLPENLRKGYSRISVDGLSDDEFNTLLGDVATEVDGIAKETIARGSVLGRPFGNAGKGAQAGAGAAKEATAEEAAAVTDKLGI